MPSEFRAKYERFKSEPLLPQIARVSNAMFAVFAFWNFVLQPHPVLGLTLIAGEAPGFLMCVLLLGLILGSLTVVFFSIGFHLLAFPAFCSVFAVSSNRDPITETLSIPFFAAAILLLVKVILRIGNALTSMK